VHRRALPQYKHRSQIIQIDEKHQLKCSAATDPGGEGSIRSPQEVNGQRNHLVELVEETAARDSPKVASAMDVGGGRSGKVATAAMQIAREATGVRERGGQGWAGSV
jgi:hypothetical protein